MGEILKPKNPNTIKNIRLGKGCDIVYEEDNMTLTSKLEALEFEILLLKQQVNKK